MPVKYERELWAYVNRTHPDWSEERKKAYVYNTLRKIEERQKRKHAN